MTEPTGGNLSIRIRIAESCRIIIKWGSERVVGNGRLSLTQLSQQREAVRLDLKSVRERLAASGTVTQTEAVAGAVLHVLHERGFRILRSLFGDDMKQLQAAVDLCCRACPEQSRNQLQAGARSPRLIEIIANAQYGLPLEILPLFDVTPPTRPRNLDDVARLASRFLGFAGIVQRREMQRGEIPRDARRRLENRSKLSVMTFNYAKLPGLGHHKSYFKTHALHFDIRGPWPTSKSPYDSEALDEELAQKIWEIESDGTPQIHYFFCHCDADPRSPENHKLRFHDGSIFGTERAIKLGDLSSALARRRLAKLEDERIRPLVFLNACASGDIEPSGFGSFPDTFPASRFLGFIGTEAVVPDAFAALFAQALFSHILEAMPLGRALNQARWDMLKKKNPLGLFYAAHGDPDIRVRYPVRPDQLRSSTID